MTFAQQESHQKILTELHDTYIRKNQDYGNSFSEQYGEYGMLSLIIRLDDKLRRLKQLNGNTAQVKDENVEDTLLDLANYAIMGAMELNKGNPVKVKKGTATRSTVRSSSQGGERVKFYSADGVDPIGAIYE